MAPPVLESAREVRLGFNGAFLCVSAMERSLVHFYRRFYCSLIRTITVIVISVLVRFLTECKILGSIFLTIVVIYLSVKVRETVQGQTKFTLNVRPSQCMAFCLKGAGPRRHLLHLHKRCPLLINFHLLSWAGQEQEAVFMCIFIYSPIDPVDLQ